MAAYAIQFRRGTTTQHNSFTGLLGEVTVDTDKKTLVVHDGATTGGFPLAREGAASTASTGTFTSNVSVGGTFNVTSTSTFNDDVAIVGDLGMTGHIIPSANVTYDLGSPTMMWRDAYIGPGSLYINGKKVIEDNAGSINFTTDSNETLKIVVPGDSGTLQYSAGSIQLDGEINAITGDLQFGDHIDMNSNLIKEVATPVTGTDAANKAYVDSQVVSEITGGTRNISGVNGDFSGNVVIDGNLEIKGTSTTVNTQTLSVADNIIDLNSDVTSGTPTQNAGIRVLRGDENAVQIRWNESDGNWEMTNDGATYQAIGSLSSSSTTDLSEGDNLYFTTQRARDSISVSGDLSYADGVISFTATAQDFAYSSLTGAPTKVSDFTNDTGFITGVAFADVTSKPTTVSGYGITDAYTKSEVDNLVTAQDSLAELSGTADDVAENPTNPTNLYFTDARVYAALSADGDLSFNSSTGEFSVTTYKSADFNTDFGNKSTNDLSEGTGDNANLYYTDARVAAFLNGNVTAIDTGNFAVSSSGATFDVDMTFNNGTTNVFNIDASSGATTIAGATVINNTFNAGGNVTFSGDNVFKIENSSNTSVFDIDVSSNNTTIATALSVSNSATFNNNLTIAGDNHFTMNNSSNTTVFDVDVANNTTVIGGATTINNNLAINNSSNTAVFDIDVANTNLAIDLDMTVNNSATFKNDFSVTNSSNTNLFDIDVANTNLAIDLDMTVNNSATFNNNVAINNSSNTAVFDIDVANTTMNVDLDLTVNNSATFNNNVAINNSSNTTLVDIDVANATYAIDMDLTVNNASTFNNNLTINNSSSTALFDIDVANTTMNVDLDMTVNNSAVFNNNLTINNSSSTTMVDIDVANATYAIDMDLTVNNATVVNNNLTVNNTANTTVFDIDVANTTVDIDASLTVSNDVTFDNSITFNIDNSTTTVFSVDGSNGNVVIAGDLTVQGTTTTVNTETIELADNIILLNSNATGAASQSGGIEIERGDDVNVQFVWDEANDRWSTGTEDMYTAGAFIGDIEHTDGTTLVDMSAKSATFAGGVTANLTGNVTGNVTGDVTGDLTGDVLHTDGTVLVDMSEKALTTDVKHTDGTVLVDMSEKALTADVKHTDGTVLVDMSEKALTTDVKHTDGTVLVDMSAKSATFSGGVTADLTGDVTGQVSDISNHTTTDLAEGTNLYWTTTRTDARVQLLEKRHTHGYIVLATDESTSSHTLTWSTLNTAAQKIDFGSDGVAFSSDIADSHYAVIYINRQMARPTEAKVASTGITFGANVIAADDEIEVVFLHHNN